jgi:hypothetical protein
MQEIWKQVPGFEDYQISNYGQVKSLKKQPGIILKQSTTSNGYKYVNLSISGTVTLMKVHQLVAMSFLNHTPNGHRIVVDHIDHDKNNNRADNLQLISHRENNNKDIWRHKKSGLLLGVHRNRDKFRSRVRVNGKRIDLGTFDSEQDAHEEYMKWIS